MRWLTIVLLAAVLAAPAIAADWADGLVPDAAGGATSLSGGGTYECLSWELGTVSLLEGRRLWGDLYTPLDAPGLGASIDIKPLEPPFIGGGYVEQQWQLLVGAHLQF